ncbi:hypothetical protein NEPAR06_1068 [Nematocida parisii]|uniref:uncharacterized protein n=1 Tax=Nematocida parisii (strain ERTm1 / ATCC PRA-289) TaxID=881290 RepID=UPI000264B6E9|nr:uncharacterized protein NEPG_01207 [Nematocida parisii ERTm1]EIJ93635.1 hypothetical protein NEPG_01207 [Nematocida parisii ERTm1]KAI5142284.1 hypothetical protein NEPAR07_0026 [Nematocida parisii]KAI5154368.1 hypothetical protein NEPAR06_1068 [Nematocida parisii]KAI5155641.1 hypothetical protein NEPAR05_0012 [Nematocida parisii]|eukprot:XP_013059035.1 hypothetical protein NEPG_01207 [Nematocida parisii ERTm1]
MKLVLILALLKTHIGKVLESVNNPLLYLATDGSTIQLSPVEHTIKIKRRRIYIRKDKEYYTIGVEPDETKIFVKKEVSPVYLTRKSTTTTHEEYKPGQGKETYKEIHYRPYNKPELPLAVHTEYHFHGDPRMARNPHEDSRPPENTRPVDRYPPRQSPPPQSDEPYRERENPYESSPSYKSLPRNASYTSTYTHMPKREERYKEEMPHPEEVPYGPPPFTYMPPHQPYPYAPVEFPPYPPPIPPIEAHREELDEKEIESDFGINISPFDVKIVEEGGRIIHLRREGNNHCLNYTGNQFSFKPCSNTDDIIRFRVLERDSKSDKIKTSSPPRPHAYSPPPVVHMPVQEATHEIIRKPRARVRRSIQSLRNDLKRTRDEIESIDSEDLVSSDSLDYSSSEPRNSNHIVKHIDVVSPKYKYKLDLGKINMPNYSRQADTMYDSIKSNLDTMGTLLNQSSTLQVPKYVKTHRRIVRPVKQRVVTTVPEEISEDEAIEKAILSWSRRKEKAKRNPLEEDYLSLRKKRKRLHKEREEMDREKERMERKEKVRKIRIEPEEDSDSEGFSTSTAHKLTYKMKKPRPEMYMHVKKEKWPDLKDDMYAEKAYDSSDSYSASYSMNAEPHKFKHTKISSAAMQMPTQFTAHTIHKPFIRMARPHPKQVLLHPIHEIHVDHAKEMVAPLNTSVTLPAMHSPAPVHQIVKPTPMVIHSPHIEHVTHIPLATPITPITPIAPITPTPMPTIQAPSISVSSTESMPISLQSPTSISAIPPASPATIATPPMSSDANAVNNLLSSYFSPISTNLVDSKLSSPTANKFTLPPISTKNTNPFASTLTSTDTKLSDNKKSTALKKKTSKAEVSSIPKTDSGLIDNLTNDILKNNPFNMQSGLLGNNPMDANLFNSSLNSSLLPSAATSKDTSMFSGLGQNSLLSNTALSSNPAPKPAENNSFGLNGLMSNQFNMNSADTSSMINSSSSLMNSPFSANSNTNPFGNNFNDSISKNLTKSLDNSSTANNTAAAKPVDNTMLYTDTLLNSTPRPKVEQNSMDLLQNNLQSLFGGGTDKEDSITVNGVPHTANT